MAIILDSTSYSINTKSDFVYNLIVGYITAINKVKGYSKGKTLFGKYIIISDTVLPNEKRLVISKVRREGITEIVIKKASDLIPVALEMLGVANKDMIDYCKQNLKKKHIDSIYYYVSAMADTCIVNSDFNATKAKYVISNHLYKGVHTLTEKYRVIFDFAQTPDSANLYTLLNTFNDDNGGFESMVALIATIVEADNLPEYIAEKYTEKLEDFGFIRNLLSISIALLKTKTRDEFSLYIITGMLGK